MNIDWSLLERSIVSRLNATEQQALKQWLEESPDHRDLYRDVKNFLGNSATYLPDAERTQQFKLAYEGRLTVVERTKRGRRLFRQMSIAASFLVVLGASLFLLLNDYRQKNVMVTDARRENLIPPGTSKAILVTQEGKTVNLNTGVPVVEVAGGLKVKNQGNALIYTDTVLDALKYEENQLIIPRGGEYSIRLSDGTQVWLNSASELRYPVHFAGGIRRVYLKGEAYFQVAHDKQQAFIVMTDEVEVKVYGTEFNVNTRVAGCVQTTLVNGSVSIRGGQSAEQMLQPDQMAEYNPENGLMDIREVDVANYVSWKSGVYVFENRTVEQIMEELALWYDVEVFFRNNSSRSRCFSGSLPRYREIGEMLSMIEKTSYVRFEVKGRTVIVN